MKTIIIDGVEYNLTPKASFKKGDWITDGIDVDKIIGIDLEDEDYLFENNTKSDISLVESISHLWTIQDAKDGDVLSFNDGHGNDSIELIKSITDKKIEFWFCLTNGNRYEVFDGITPYTNLVSREDATPATKEQRDKLEKAITAAGYKWNKEKKELKKIEEKSIDKIVDCEKPLLEKFKQAVYDCAWGKVTYKVKGESQKEYANRWAKQLLILVRDWADDYIDSREDAIRRRYFDKGKQSIQNLTWSEEDERMFTLCASSVKTRYNDGLLTCNEYEQVSLWLKSLKERYAWKPSDEQMEAMKWEINNTSEGSWQRREMESLYQYLKKLREE